MKLLFKIVNELVDPKIKEVAKEVEVLEMKGSAKELNGQKELLAELKDFNEELLLGRLFMKSVSIWRRRSTP